MDEDKDPLTDEQIVEAVNDLVAGVTTRWEHDPTSACTILANALGAAVARLDMSYTVDDTREYLNRFYEFVDAGRETLFDVLDKR